ncbi:MAG: hypothetical protein PHX80_05385 [Candidatus Nanoarchaeia archaeon]|nr:hypothetical protein [Candidatus Nanoarchaeia archaeon]
MATKSIYVKPEIIKVKQMNFMFAFFKKSDHKIICRQCSGCHGCR